MNTAVIITKTEPEIKAKAQKVAKDLGLTLSSLINAWLRQLIQTKAVTFSVESEKPSPYLVRMLKKADKEIKEGKVSPAFDDVEDAIKWLHEKSA